jgi:hypothetical protein
MVEVKIKNNKRKEKKKSMTTIKLTFRKSPSDSSELSSTTASCLSSASSCCINLVLGKKIKIRLKRCHCQVVIISKKSQKQKVSIDWKSADHWNWVEKLPQSRISEEAFSEIQKREHANPCRKTTKMYTNTIEFWISTEFSFECR